LSVPPVSVLGLTQFSPLAHPLPMELQAGLSGFSELPEASAAMLALFLS
jgi:hypothetical protein